MVDERGKIFGIINFIDLLVLLLVSVVAVKILIPHFVRGPVSGQEVEVTVLVPIIRQPTVAAISPGSKVFNTTDNTTLGTVVSANPVKGILLTQRQDGTMGEGTSTVYFDDYVTIKGMGTVNASGVVLGKTQIRMGEPFPFSDKFFGVQGTVWAVSPLPPGWSATTPQLGPGPGQI